MVKNPKKLNEVSNKNNKYFNRLNEILEKKNSERKILNNKLVNNSSETKIEEFKLNKSSKPMIDLNKPEIKALIKKGKSEGYITHDELNKALLDGELTSEQIEDAMIAINELGINIIEDQIEESYSENIKMLETKEKELSDILNEKENNLNNEEINFELEDLLTSVKWYSENELFEDDEKEILDEAISIISKNYKLNEVEIALCRKVLDEHNYKGDILKRILDINFRDLEKALDQTSNNTPKEIINLIETTINKLSNNEYNKISYKEAKVSINFLDDHKLSFEDNNSSKINYSLDDNDDILGIPAFLRKPSRDDEIIYEDTDNDEEILDVDIELNTLNKMIDEINALLEFSKEVDENLIVSFVDGHTSEIQNHFIKRLMEVDEELKEEINLLKKGNIFFGRVSPKIKENPEALAELIEYENKLKKTSVNPVKQKNNININFLFFRLKNFFSNLKLQDFSFSAVVSSILIFGILTAPARMMMSQHPSLISIENYKNKEDIFKIASIYNQETRNVSQNNNEVLQDDYDNSKCSFPKTNFSQNNFSKYFQIKVIKSNSGKSFILKNNGFVQIGDKIMLFLKAKKSDRIVVKYHNEKNIKNNKIVKLLNNECELINLIDEEYFSNGKKFNVIGKNTGYQIQAPLGKDTLIISFKNDKDFSGTFSFTTIDLLKFQINLEDLNWNKLSQHIQLKNTQVYKFYSKYFTQNFLPYKQIHQSWGQKNTQLKNKYEKVYIDFNGDNKADLIAIDKNFDGEIDYYALDKNDNNVIDTLVYPIIEKNNLKFRWLIDENEDKNFEKYGLDYNNDWLVDFKGDL